MRCCEAMCLLSEEWRGVLVDTIGFDLAIAWRPVMAHPFRLVQIDGNNLC